MQLHSGSILDTDPGAEMIARVLALKSEFIGLVASDGSKYWSIDIDDLPLSWDDPHEMERPLLFRTLARCKARCKREGPDWRPMVWISSDMDRTQIDKYIGMDGYRYPSNPRQ